MKISKNTPLMVGLKLVVAAAMLAAPAIGSAAVTSDDDFETYAPGSLAGGAAGTGWGAGWTVPAGSATVLDTTGTPLTYSVLGGGTIAGATRAAQSAPTAVNSGQVTQSRQIGAPRTSTTYVSFLLQYSGTSVVDGNDTFSLYLSDGASAPGNPALTVGARATVGTVTFMVRQGTGGPVAGGFITNVPGMFAAGQTYLVVAQYVWDGTSFSTINAWLNPAYGESGTPLITQSLTAGTGKTSISHVFFRNYDNNNDGTSPNDFWTVDNLVIGDNWDDVVPSAGPPLARAGVSTSPSSYIPVLAQTVTAGNSITVYAVALDAGGNYLSNTPAVWSPINVTGGISGNDIVAVGDGSSAVFTGNLAGSANLRATPPTGALVYNDSGLITVQAAAASQVRVETAADGSGTVVPAQNVAPGNSITVYAISRDMYGNFVANISATWSLANRTSGIVNGDLVGSGTSATFTGNLSGTANIRAASGALTSVDSGLITVSRAVTWVGGGANNWDFVALNWTPDFGFTKVAFLDSDDVTFDFSSANTTVNLTATVQPNSVSVSGSSYTLQGAGGISGSGALTNAAGFGNKLTLLTSNDYTGLTVITGGELQLGNGVQNGSFGLGNVIVNTGLTNPIFNRVDSPASPYVISNQIGGPVDFVMEFKSGAVAFAGSGDNNHAQAIVRNGATLIMAKPAGKSVGNNVSVFSGPVLTIDAGGKVICGGPGLAGDAIDSGGRYVQFDGTFDLHSNETLGPVNGAATGRIDNTSTNDAIVTIGNQGGNLPSNGMDSTFNGIIQNTGAGTLGLTKTGTNTLFLGSANTFRGDTRIDFWGSVLKLGNINSLQNSTVDRRNTDEGELNFGTLTSANLGGLKGVRGFALENESAAALALSIGGNGQDNSFSGDLSGPGSLTKTGAGVQTLSGTNSYAGATTVSQGGLIVNGGLSGSGSVTVSGNGTLGGNGFINGAVSVSGTLAPGNNNIGKLTVNNTVTLSGTAVMEINGSLTAPANCDVLAATTINLGGGLVVTNRGPSLKSGDTFTLFSGTLNNSITPSSLPVLWPGLTWNTSTLNSAGVISVTGTAVPPVIDPVTVVGGALVVSGSGGLPGGTYYLVKSTDVALPLGSWTRISTNVFAADGKFTNSIPINLAVPQEYFTIQAQ